MKTLSRTQLCLPSRVALLSICLSIMAAASNGAPVQSPLGTNAADDAVLVGGDRLFPATPVFLALDDAQEWLLPGFSIARPGDDDTQAPDAFLAVPDGAAPDHIVDLWPMLLSALEEERVVSAALSFGPALPTASTRTSIVEHA